MIALLTGTPKQCQSQAAGALWSMSLDAPSNQELVSTLEGIEPLVALLRSGDDEAQTTSAGALYALSALPANRTLIANAKGVCPLVALFEEGSELAIEQASGALAKLVIDNEAVQVEVAEEVVRLLTNRQEVLEGGTTISTAGGADVVADELPTTTPSRSGRSRATREWPGAAAGTVAGAAVGGEELVRRSSAAAMEHATFLLEVLCKEPGNRVAIAKAGAIKQLAAQVRDGSERSWGAAASALSQLVLKSSSYRIQSKLELIQLLVEESQQVRQRAGEALRRMAEVCAGEPRVSLAQLGGVERFVALLERGFVEAQEFTLWLFWQSTDLSSRTAVAKSICGKHIVAACLSGRLSARALEHAAAVVSDLTTANTLATVEHAEHALNLADIVSAGGILPLVELLHEGNAGAKRHAALALAQLTDRDELELAYSTQMQIIEAGAIGALVDWLLPEQAVQRRAQRQRRPTKELLAEVVRLPMDDSCVDVSKPSTSPPGGHAAAAKAGTPRREEPSMGEQSAGAARRPPSKAHSKGGDDLDDLLALLDGPSAFETTTATTAAVPTMTTPLTGPPELAARAISKIAWRNKDAQTHIAEEGALAPLVAMVHLEPLLAGSRSTSPGSPGGRSPPPKGGRRRSISTKKTIVGDPIEMRRWAAAALATLADDNACNRIEIAEEGGIAPLVTLVQSEREGALYTRQDPNVVESATHALFHLAADEDIKLAIVRPSATNPEGGVPPLVRLVHLDDEGSEATKEWAAAALEALAIESHENQLVLAKADSISPLTMLLASDHGETRNRAAGALLHIASARENLTDVVVPLVELLEVRNPGALKVAVQLLAGLAARSSAGRTAIADSGGIPQLVRMLGDGANPAQLQMDAAACLFDLARTQHGKSAIASSGGTSPLIAMLGCSSVEAQTHAAGALWLLSTAVACQTTVVSAGGIEPLVALLSSASLGAATHAANALGQLGSSADTKGAIVKAGAIAPLVALLDVDEAHLEARESASAVLALLALAKKDGARESIVRAGGIAPLVRFLASESSSPALVKHATCALWGLTSEPHFQAVVAKAGALPHLVRLLQADKCEAQGHAAATLANMAADPTSRHIITEKTNALNVLAGLEKGKDSTGNKDAVSAWLKKQAAEILKLLNEQNTSDKSAATMDKAIAVQSEQKAAKLKERRDAQAQAFRTKKLEEASTSKSAAARLAAASMAGAPGAAPTHSGTKAGNTPSAGGHKASATPAAGGLKATLEKGKQHPTVVATSARPAVATPIVVSAPIGAPMIAMAAAAAAATAGKQPPGAKPLTVIAVSKGKPQMPPTVIATTKPAAPPTAMAAPVGAPAVVVSAPGVAAPRVRPQTKLQLNKLTPNAVGNAESMRAPQVGDTHRDSHRSSAGAGAQRESSEKPPKGEAAATASMPSLAKEEAVAPGRAKLASRPKLKFPPGSSMAMNAAPTAPAPSSQRLSERSTGSAASQRGQPQVAHRGGAASDRQQARAGRLPSKEESQAVAVSIPLATIADAESAMVTVAAPSLPRVPVGPGDPKGERRLRALAAAEARDVASQSHRGASAVGPGGRERANNIDDARRRAAAVCDDRSAGSKREM